jgi:4-alpha-glucanotransferase
MTGSLDDLAKRYGIPRTYPGPLGDVEVPDATRLHFLRSMGVDLESCEPAVATPDEANGKSVAEPRCYFPNWLRTRRSWGIAAQLYELRSERNWGIGDFADLARFCSISAGTGADFVGLNPLHALFLAEPERCSPFSPSNRRFLNPLYIAVDEVPGFEPGMTDAQELRRLRELTFVDYPAVARVKLEALGRIWSARREEEREAVGTFAEEGGDALRRHALFEALSLHLKAEGHGSGWKSWPADYASPDRPAAQAFARDRADEVQFQLWLQLIARRQLARAAQTASSAGMKIGLYLDFAVGEAPDGSATWGNPALAVSGVKIGAPPDVFSANGQDWGLTPLSPAGMARDGFRSYAELMGSAMRDAGALRIDHAMSLRQLFWIPDDAAPADGGFIQYPTDGLLGALADASQRSRTLVIGEDLGHVPEGFREMMADAGILSYRILYFERDGSRFIRPRAWPVLSIACLSTHDLPTLAGWWIGSDVALRHDHGLIDGDEAVRQRRARIFERKEMLSAFTRNAVMSRRDARALAGTRRAEGLAYEALAVAAHRFIGRTRSRLACLRLADAVGEEHPTNLPGTSDSYHNWQRKLDVPLERLPSLRLFHRLTQCMNRERPR